MKDYNNNPHKYIKNWEDLIFKDKLSYIFAIVCFILGWIITFIAFFIEPIGTVADSVLYILGQSLLFSGGIIGIGHYYNAQTQNFKYEIKKFIKSKGKDLEDVDDIDES